MGLLGRSRREYRHGWECLLQSLTRELAREDDKRTAAGRPRSISGKYTLTCVGSPCKAVPREAAHVTK